MPTFQSAAEEEPDASTEEQRAASQEQSPLAAEFFLGPARYLQKNTIESILVLKLPFVVFDMDPSNCILRIILLYNIYDVLSRISLTQII